MNYIVFDLELNSKIFKSRHPNEIIEIGAIKLGSNLEIADSFQSFVKPRMFVKLFPIIKRKTGIAQEDINNAPLFKDVLAEFREWAGKECTYISWGHDDIHHFKTNCEFNHRSSKWIEPHLDIQKQFSKMYNLPSGQRYSLSGALEILGIPVRDELHRAEADARYTAEIFRKVYPKLI